MLRIRLCRSDLFLLSFTNASGSDYGDALRGWNLERTERLDVKKPGPGPFVDTQSAFATAYDVDTPAFFFPPQFQRQAPPQRQPIDGQVSE